MRLHKEDIPFTMVANDVLRRTDLSLKAKGMYAYLFSKPDGWDFSGHRIVKEMSDGRYAVFQALRELEATGLISRVRQPDGRMDYTIQHASHVPKTGIRLFQGQVSKTQIAKTEIKEIDTISNTDSSKTDIKKKGKEKQPRAAAVVEHSPVNDLIDLFKAVNPSYARLFANKTQRGAIERMVKQYGVEQTKRIIEYACKVSGLEHAPVITTPYDLEAKMGKLVAYGKRQKSRVPQLVAID